MFSLSKVSLRRVSIISGGLMKPLSCIIQRSYAQSPVFEIVHDESVKVYLHMYNEKGQQISLCVESCVTKGRFRP